jgi:hypothetical protein
MWWGGGCGDRLLGDFVFAVLFAWALQWCVVGRLMFRFWSVAADSRFKPSLLVRVMGKVF